jgi:hypothetical protein
MGRLLRRLPSLRRREPDPFATLELQLRLGRLSSELDALSGARVHAFAVGHHARAAELAYDRSLAEACSLIGADVPPGRGPAARLEMESTLLRAGWTW